MRRMALLTSAPTPPTALIAQSDPAATLTTLPSPVADVSQTVHMTIPGLTTFLVHDGEDAPNKPGRRVDIALELFAGFSITVGTIMILAGSMAGSSVGRIASYIASVVM